MQIMHIILIVYVQEVSAQGW